MKRKKLGEVLRERGKISLDDLQNVVSDQQGKMLYLGEILLERGLVSKLDIAAALEEVSHFSYLDCSSVIADGNALALVTRAVAERCLALPIRLEGKSLIVAMAEPQNLAIVAELRFTAGVDIKPRLAFRSELRDAIQRHYPLKEGPGDKGPRSSATKEVITMGMSDIKFEEIEFFSTSSRQSNQEAIQEMQADLRQRKTPAVQLVSEMIQMALAKHASDIHIEPRAYQTSVRIRVDGVLRDLQSIPRGLQNSLVSRVKILSDMDIAERRSPQDGRFMVQLGVRQVDLRVSTLPTQYGEKVVMRLLESTAQVTSLRELGMSPDVEELLSDLLVIPQGMILVTGPTGSGKSTTLYSALNMLRKTAVNIVTVEDPIEYVLPGINQSHVNTKAGLTFASCIRSILRQDPNIIMVGEIRDSETAEIAMKAAQTGHMVLSTLHTNDSVSAIVRLLDLGVPGYLIGSSLTGILAQRLVRKLCSCHSIEPADAEFQRRLARIGVQAPKTMAVPLGCPQCDSTGYAGRIGVFELLNFDDSVRSAVRVTARSDEIRAAARSRGMRTMQEDAIRKLYAGLTTLDELARVISFEAILRTDCVSCGQHVLAAYRFCPHCGVTRDTEIAMSGPVSERRILAESLP
jgi:type IV pilus assembly protein PilB